MAFKKVRFDDDLLRLSIICLSLVIIYLFIIIPLKISLKGTNSFQDVVARQAHRLFYSREINPDITIVSLDDVSLREEHLKWPWPRTKFTQLIKAIDSYGPKVIAMDISFIGKSSYGQEDDAQLAEAIKEAGNVILASYIGADDTPVIPLKEIRESAAGVGFVNKVKDKSSIVRYTRAVALQEGKLDYSFEIKSACLYKEIPIPSIKISGRQLHIGEDSIRLNWYGRFPIRYRATPANFNTISISKLLKGEFDAELIKNRLVMVGLTSESLHDIYITPFGSMPGVIVSANVLENLLDADITRRLPSVYTFLLFLITCIIAAYMGLRFSLLLSFVITTIIASLLYLLAIFAFKHSIEFDLFGALILLYLNFSIARLYLSVKLYIEKYNMLKLLTLDEETGLYNMYFLLVRLQHMIEVVKDRKNFPSLILLAIADKERRSLTLDKEAKKEFTVSIASVVKNSIKHVNGLLAKTSDFEFGIIVPRQNREGLDSLADSIFERLNGLELILSTDKKRVAITVAMGMTCGPEMEETSARMMIYASEEALSRARRLVDKKIYVFDVKKEKIGEFAEGYTPSEIEGKLLDFVIEDLKQRNKQLDLNIDKQNMQIKSLKDSYLTVISSLVKALEEKDIYTAGHSERVARYSIVLADFINMEESSTETLRQAALLHDVGKIAIPDSILHKKEELSEDDKKVIQKHAIEGVRILEPVKFFKDTFPLILHHHEHYDGSGYPHGLTSERIPLGSRIIALADAFDAMTSGRGYNRPLKTDEAFAILKKDAGGQFDPDLVEKFIKAISALPDQK